MNIHKVLISVLAFGAMASTSILFAQDKKNAASGKATEAAIARYDEAGLALKPDQKTKIQAILAKSQSQIAALPQEERRTKGAAIRETSNKEIRALLTPDQQKKFDAMPPAATGGGKKK
jgi:hypothetical protein